MTKGHLCVASSPTRMPVAAQEVSRGRGGNDKIGSERDLRLDGVGDKALGFDAFHDFAGAFELGLVFEADAGPNRDLRDLVLAFNVLKQTFGVAFICRRSDAF